MGKKELSTSVDESLSETLFNKYIDTEIMRQKIIGIFNEQIKTVDFSKLVKEYAAEEMDNRLFRSVKYWMTVIITALVSGVLSAVAYALIVSRG